MTYFVVSYDPGRVSGEAAQDDLRSRLAELRGVQVQRSLWFVEWPASARDLLHHLEEAVPDLDHLMVAQLTSRPAWRYALRGTGNWLNARF